MMLESKHVILDTDAFNEIDDQFAISYLVKKGGITIEAINSCPFFNNKVKDFKEGMEKSYDEILKVIKLANLSYDIQINKGSEVYLKSKDEPVVSEAAKCIIEKSLSFDRSNPLYVVAIGCLTNVASAILLDPTVVDRIKIIFLGGVGKDFRGCFAEFNLSGDILASQVVYEKAKQFVMLPCQGVVSELRTTQPELKCWLSNKNKLCDYLVENTINEANSYASNKPWSRVIWDISAITYLFNDNNRFLQIRNEARIYPIDCKNYVEIENKEMEYVYRVNRDNIFDDLFKVLTK